MKNIQPIVLSIQDLSCYGRCSLAVALPIISATKVQVIPLPTAILSAHLGGLGDVAVRELNGFLTETLEHYQSLSISFDAIYNGYLANHTQIERVEDFWAAYPNAIRMVDPVMGDQGEPYSRFDEKMRTEMKKLVSNAHIITPNLTEVAILLDRDYVPPEEVSKELMEEMLVELSNLGPHHVIITGARLDDKTITNCHCNKETGTFHYASSKYYPASYAGTGDAFASAFIGTLLSTGSYDRALEDATGFLEHAVGYTYSHKTNPNLGIMLEPCLGWFYERNCHEQ